MNNNQFEFSPLLAASILGCSLVACQDLTDVHTTPPVLASVRGTLSLAEGMPAPEGDIRLAVVWTTGYLEPPPDQYTSDPTYPCAVDPSKLPADPMAAGGYHRFRNAFAEQQLELETEFPVQFRLDISEPPPDGAVDIPPRQFARARQSIPVLLPTRVIELFVLLGRCDAG